MTEDVILDVTADFVRSSKTNLKLALQVERAMPSVREHFVRAVLGALEAYFPRPEWTIDRSALQDVMAKGAKLWLASEAWTTYQHETAIWLGSDQPSWKRVWIGLYFTGGSSRKVQPVEQSMAPLAESGYRVEASADEPGVYKYLDGELRDWSGERFLTRSLEDGPDGIASDIFAELKKLDKIVRSLPR